MNATEMRAEANRLMKLVDPGRWAQASTYEANAQIIAKARKLRRYAKALDDQTEKWEPYCGGWGNFD